MTINESDSSSPYSPDINEEDELENGKSENLSITEEVGKKQICRQSAVKTSIIQKTAAFWQNNSSLKDAVSLRILLFTNLAIALTLIGIVINNSFLGILGTLAALLLSLIILFPWLKKAIQDWFSPQERNIFVGFVGIFVAIIGLFKFTNLGKNFLLWGKRINWDASGTLAEWFGALGQISIAIIAVYVAWRQYVISKDLTIQQNLLTVQQNIITQQQTIDSYFQGVSDLVLDEEGLLEDWPQERAIAEGRTAAIFSSVDASGKAKILRFLSRSKLLTPLQRDRRLGRAILDGSGGYAEDRLEGVRVIDLGIMLASADLSATDLRWTDLSEANLVRANLTNCDLVKANLSRTILYDANLSGADLNGIRLFYGSGEQASPRSRTQPPNYETGEQTGAVVENANFSNVQRMSESARYYCCAWCGEKSRNTIPGGCEGIPNKLGK
ncbi:pentapeptide repeat-containing protein [Anabaena sp. UHCC 0204]|uniref:pentapeptide repeat-containing protein n=1 Tax=Anabaena sp. UHCC 0204 TaxID=2590009 RepID=UPI001447F30C|nr:pentapeptide repeat-containing protein [Anabaena sp. UHCC 0204]MTJ08591.1 pentapeptide repeat-containing protein [Anabaena sp. UHCC 0204]